MSVYKSLQSKFYKWLDYEPPTNEIAPYDFGRLKYEIRPGDVLLIEGRSRISSVIRTVTQSPWTHAALYLGRLIDFEDEGICNIIRQHTDAKENARLLIEDLVDKGTVITPLSFYRHHHLRICRPIGITPTDTHLVINYAIRALGQPYNVRQLIDLARFMLPWSVLPRRWGSTLFRTSSGKPESGVCSSLIAEAFSSVHFPILPYVKSDNAQGIELYHRNPYIFTPKDFDYSPYFNIIKYPLFNPDEPLPYYRRLPWASSGLYHSDEGEPFDPQQKSKNRFKIFRRRGTENKMENKSDPEMKTPPDESPHNDESN